MLQIMDREEWRRIMPAAIENAAMITVTNAAPLPL
jgi:hypothetical protein